jgi:hypothetical protein
MYYKYMIYFRYEIMLCKDICTYSYAVKGDMTVSLVASLLLEWAPIDLELDRPPDRSTGQDLSAMPAKGGRD